MTNKEAADLLKQTQITLTRGTGKVLLAEALRLAISALEERKCGEWIKMSDADGVYFACSICGENLLRTWHFDPQFDLFPRLESINKTNYCPNCGADMRGEANDCS